MPTTTDLSPHRTAGNLPLPVRRARTVALFLAVTFAWTWTIELVGLGRMAGDPSIDRLGIWVLVASFGPTLGALAAVVHEHGPGGIRILLSRLGPIRQRWTVWAFAAYALVPAAAIAVLAFSPGHLAKALPEALLLAFVPLVGLFSIVAGPLGEELGWRGVLLPVALTKFGPWLAAVLVGAVWALWHAPLWTTSDFIVDLPAHTLIPLFIVSLIAMSIVMTVLHLRASGSVLIAMLAHGVFNSIVLPLDDLRERGLLTAPVAWPFTLAVVATAAILAVVNRNSLRRSTQ